MTLAMNRDELTDYMEEVFPQIRNDFAIDELTEDTVIVRLLTDERHLRPGGTVSGPSMFALADGDEAAQRAGQGLVAHVAPTKVGDGGLLGPGGGGQPPQRARHQDRHGLPLSCSARTYRPVEWGSREGAVRAGTPPHSR